MGIAAITGSGSGIGAAVKQRFEAEGDGRSARGICRTDHRGDPCSWYHQPRGNCPGSVCKRHSYGARWSLARYDGAECPATCGSCALIDGATICFEF